MRIGKKPVWAIKFRNFCFNKDLRAKDLSKMLGVSTGTIYKYWEGKITIPDSSKKVLETELDLDIYEIFYSEEL